MELAPPAGNAGHGSPNRVSFGQERTEGEPPSLPSTLDQEAKLDLRWCAQPHCLQGPRCVCYAGLVRAAISHCRRYHVLAPLWAAAFGFNNPHERKADKQTRR